MARHILGAFAVLLFGLALAPSAAAQPSSRACSLSAMPPLPADASRRPPAARRSYEWQPGYYRCAGGSWDYVPGHWRRASAAIEAAAAVELRGERLFARPGFRFERTGPNSAVVARIAGGGRPSALNVTGTYSCACECYHLEPGCSLSGGCLLDASGNGLSCGQSSCSHRCKFRYTRDGPAVIGALEGGGEEAALCPAPAATAYRPSQPTLAP